MTTNVFGISLRLMVVALAMLFAGSVFAAKTWVWEAENITGQLSGKAFQIAKLTRDPTGKVSEKQVLTIPKAEKGKKIPEDSVQYKINVPADGSYYLWARVRWSTGCGNSVNMSIDGVKGSYVITSGTYDALHWLALLDGKNPLKLTLKKGAVTLTLTSKENGLMLDQFLLTDTARYRPADIYTATKDFVLDK